MKAATQRRYVPDPVCPPSYCPARENRSQGNPTGPPRPGVEAITRPALQTGIQEGEVALGEERVIEPEALLMRGDPAGARVAALAMDRLFHRADQARSFCRGGHRSPGGGKPKGVMPGACRVAGSGPPFTGPPVVRMGEQPLERVAPLQGVRNSSSACSARSSPCTDQPPIERSQMPSSR